jgi:hypothetical protein
MLGGFRELSPSFLGGVLSRKLKRPVRVRKVRLTDYADSPDNVRGAAGLRKLDLQTTVGSVHLMVKTLDPPRRREARVWQFLLQAGEMPLPEVYHVEYDERSGVYGLILEYLAPLSETQAWDQPQCRRVGAALARLHGRYWGRTEQLPDVFPAPQSPPEAAVEPAVRRFLDRISARRHALLDEAVPEVFGFLARLLRMPQAFFEEAADLPRTLIHGALDRWEVLFRPHGQGPQPLLIDWEYARIGRCAEDLASLCNSLPPEARRAGRDAMVGTYLEGLRSGEVAAAAGPLNDEIDRQRILQAARNMPQLCRLYSDRRDQGEYRHWCDWFLQVAGKDVIELKKLLDDMGREETVPEA